MLRLFSVLAAAVVIAGLWSAATAEEEGGKKAKKTIKEVMKDAHKSGLHKKVLSEKASKKEREELLELYIAMSDNSPPKGDQKSWKILTSRLIIGADDAVNDPSDVKELKKATNCGNCHKKHKKS